MEEQFDEAGFSRLFVTNDDALSCLVAVDPRDGTLAGFQGLTKDRRLPDGWADIATFARMDNKISGTGAALFAATVRKALTLRLATINAAIRADNRSGLSYYARMGFRTWQVLKAVPLRDGTPVDRVFKRFDFDRGTGPAHP